MTTEWVLQSDGFVDHTTSWPVRGFKHLSSEDQRRLLNAGVLPAHIMQLWLTELLSRDLSASADWLWFTESDNYFACRLSSLAVAPMAILRAPTGFYAWARPG